MTDLDADPDTLPGLDDLVDVPPDAVAELRASGHTVLRGLASRAEVEAYRPAIEQAAAEHNLEVRPLAERDTYGQAFLQTANLWRTGDAVRRFVHSRRFAAAAAALLDVEGVRLYHDQALFKEPGGGHTPWHQDQLYWPLATDRTITMWMPLVDVSAEVGSMTFAAGSHRAGDLRGRAISDRSEVEFAELVAQQGLPEQTHGAMAAGDATFHCGWTLHRAGPNPTERMRSVMTIIYMADGTEVATPDNPYQEFDRQVWLGSQEPGTVISGDLNPRLYP